MPRRRRVLAWPHWQTCTTQAPSVIFSPAAWRDGWKCLEIGGGLGTITRWLSDRVGAHGYVLTTDIDTRFLATIGRANVEVRRHDILTDPLPDATFDLAYARLVLEHLSDPDLALDRMVMALKPGGWLMVEDFEVHVVRSRRLGPISVSKTVAAMRRVAARRRRRSALGSLVGPPASRARTGACRP